MGKVMLGSGPGAARGRRFRALGATRIYAEGPGVASQGSLQRHDLKDQGSEFTVRLPAAPAVQLSSTTKSAGKGAASHGESDFCVLIVDDNRDVADSTAMLVRMAGYDVHLAYDGKGAIESAQRLQPDAVLLDIGLPGIDGYEVAERIRGAALNGKPSIVAVSGYGQDEHRARSRKAGFDHHIVKPIDPDVLTELLASLRTTRGSSPENVVRFPGQNTAK